MILPTNDEYRNMNMNPDRFPVNAKLLSAQVDVRYENSYVVDVYFESDECSGNMCIEARHESPNVGEQRFRYWYFYEEGGHITAVPQEFLDWHNSEREDFCLE